MIRSATGRAPVTSQAAVPLDVRIQTLHKHYTIGIRMYLSMKSSLVFLIYFFSSNTRMALSAPQSDEFELQFYSTMLMDTIGETTETVRLELVGGTLDVDTKTSF